MRQTAKISQKLRTSVPTAVGSVFDKGYRYGFNWKLNDNQIKDLSYLGLTSAKGFHEYINQKAGITNPNWQDDIESTDPKKREDYSKNNKLYNDAYNSWKTSVVDITTSKTYYNKSGVKVKIEQHVESKD